MVLELVGAPQPAGNLKAIETLGRIIMIGVGAGAQTGLNLGLMTKRAQHQRLHDARPPARGEGADAAAAERQGLPCSRAATSGCRSPPRTRSRRAEKAYEHFTAGGKLGKIVLTP